MYLAVGCRFRGGVTIKNTYDPDALAYLNAVEAADTQSLESSVKAAINSFVVGCKADGIWTALVGSCIMAGARTLSGALVPLRGNAPSNSNFVSGDYNRKTGILGDASTKTISTNYNNTDLPQDDAHVSCYVTQAPTTSATLTRMFIGQVLGAGGRIWMLNNSSGNLNLKNRINLTGGTTITSEGTTAGFKGHSRSSSTNTTIRTSQTNTTNTTASTTLVSGAIAVFSDGASARYSDARMSFYSLGTNVDLALLDTRITALMTTFNAIL